MHSSKSDSDVRQEQEYILEIAEEVGNRAKHRKAYDDLGNANSYLGNFHTAIHFFELNLKTAKALNNKAQMGTAYSNLGTCYQNLGLYSIAEEYHERHLETALEVGDRLGKLHAYRNIGIARGSSGNVNDAIEYHRIHLTLAGELDDAAEKGRAYESLGSCYFSIRDFGKAIYCYEQHLRISKETGDKIQEGIACGNLGKAHQFQNDFELARIFHELCLEIANETGNSVGIADSFFNIGRSYESLGHLDKALEFYKRCVSVYHDLRGRLKFEDEWKMSVRNVYQTEYASVWRLLLRQGKVIEALLSADKGRAQSLRDQLEWKYELQTNETETGTLNRVSSRVFPSHVISIAINNREVAFWVLREGMEVEFRKKQISDNMHMLLRGESEDFVNAFRQKNDDDIETITECEDFVNSFRQENDDDIKTKFYENFIAPIQDLLPGEDLIFIPEGQLCLAPFAVFMDANSKYLNEFHRIRVVPSLLILTVMATCPSDYHRTTGALVVGDPYLRDVRHRGKNFEPLPYGNEEAKKIAQMLSTRPLVGKEATKDKILKLMPSVALVHIAAHGTPESGMFFAPSLARFSPKPREEDYLFTLKEVWSLQLRAKLVVLSTCHSAYGKISPEGVVNMARGFLGAGARSVLASLWAVDDESSLQFMTYFYEHLREGKTASEALKQAMKCMRESKNFNKERYWAPYVLLGDDVTLKEHFTS